MLLGLALVPTLAAAGETMRIPIQYHGIEVSFEVPERWANGPFPFRQVPADLYATAGASREYALWIREWTWNRSWFRGRFGRMMFDAWMKIRDPHHLRSQDTGAAPREFDLTAPDQLLTYVREDAAHTVGAQSYVYELVDHGGATWVRRTDSQSQSNGVPTSESWYIGLTRDVYFRLNIASMREADDDAGEQWLKAALYWQNRIIDSIRVSGVRQTRSGTMRVENWTFPPSLSDETQVPPPK